MVEVLCWPAKKKKRKGGGGGGGGRGGARFDVPPAPPLSDATFYPLLRLSRGMERCTLVC